MDCEELAWYAQQGAALQMRVRMLACFVASLHGTDVSQELPGACRGARQERDTFEDIVRWLVAPSGAFTVGGAALHAGGGA